MLLSLVLLLAQASPAPSPSPAASPTPPPESAAAREEAPVVTHHEVRAGGRPLKYTVTTGYLPIKNETGDTEADVFFIAYVADRPGPPAQRPLMFSFNGGPGSSSVWLHLGALGPRRVKMLAEGGMPAPPYQLVENEATWLDQTDLVFIDPVGTGYSRARKPDLGKKFWGLEGDIQSVGEFIRMYLSRYERWGSPLFLVGESYGTTRAAGLAGHLVDRGIAFNGILLVSSILNFQTARFGGGNDTPYPLFLPTYAATAWYHGKLSPELQRRPLREFLREVESWAAGEYIAALDKGDALAGAERAAAVERLARYTGLDKTYVANADLRVDIQSFCKELLRDERRTVGRLDSRFKGIDLSGTAQRPEFDPSMAAIRPPYTAALNDYVRRSLGFKSDRVYHILGGGIGSPWDWGAQAQGQGFANVSEALRSALAKNPSMRIFVASGFYDLATPYFATEYTLRHLGLEASQKDRIATAEYEAGHMMYIHEGELARLKKDVSGFLQAALKAAASDVTRTAAPTP